MPEHNYNVGELKHFKENRSDSFTKKLMLDFLEVFIEFIIVVIAIIFITILYLICI